MTDCACACDIDILDPRCTNPEHINAPRWATADQTRLERDRAEAAEAEVDRLTTALDGLQRAYDTSCEQTEREMDRRIAAEARAEMERLKEVAEANGYRALALEATLATVRAEHTRDRERLAKVEALADEWTEEGDSLIRNCHSGRDVNEGEQMRGCASALRAVLTTTSEEAER